MQEVDPSWHILSGILPGSQEKYFPAINSKDDNNAKFCQYTKIDNAFLLRKENFENLLSIVPFVFLLFSIVCKQ